MARYLSDEWFASVCSETEPPGSDGPTLVVEQVVRDTPGGDVTYRVEMTGPEARIVWPVPSGAPAADVRITTDWVTAVAVARGQLSTQSALMRGLLRFGGQPNRLAELAGGWEAVDPVPAAVREATTFNGG